MSMNQICSLIMKVDQKLNKAGSKVTAVDQKKWFELWRVAKNVIIIIEENWNWLCSCLKRACSPGRSWSERGKHGLSVVGVFSRGAPSGLSRSRSSWLFFINFMVVAVGPHIEVTRVVLVIQLGDEVCLHTQQCIPIDPSEVVVLFEFEGAGRAKAVQRVLKIKRVW